MKATQCLKYLWKELIKKMIFLERINNKSRPALSLPPYSVITLSMCPLICCHLLGHNIDKLLSNVKLTIAIVIPNINYLQQPYSSPSVLRMPHLL